MGSTGAQRLITAYAVSEKTMEDLVDEYAYASNELGIFDRKGAQRLTTAYAVSKRRTMQNLVTEYQYAKSELGIWHREGARRLATAYALSKKKNIKSFVTAYKYAQSELGGAAAKMLAPQIVLSDLSTAEEDSSMPLLEVLFASGDIIETVSRLLGSSSPISAPEQQSPKHGGIDFNPNNLNLNEQGNKIIFPISEVNLQNIPPDMNFNGILPVIINVVPINNLLPILGLSEREDEEQKLSKL